MCVHAQSSVDCRDYFVVVADFRWVTSCQVDFFFASAFGFVLFVLCCFSPSQFVISLFTTLFYFNDRCMRDMGIDYLFIGNFVCMLLISLIRSLRGVSIQLFHIIVIVDSIFFALLFCH